MPLIVVRTDPRRHGAGCRSRRGVVRAGAWRLAGAGLVAALLLPCSASARSAATISISASANSPVAAGQTVDFSAGGATVAGQPVTVTSYSWDFGDGSSGGGSATSHSYTVGGT